MPGMPPCKQLMRTTLPPITVDSAAIGISGVFEKAEREAATRKLGRPIWLSVCTATTVTMASPKAMFDLFQYATASKPLRERIAVAEFMREVGLRCLGIVGIPRTINVLTGFRALLPSSVASSMNTAPSRLVDASNIEAIKRRGRALWASVHGPHEAELERKLEMAHPDLPLVIIDNQYGGLFADPERTTGIAVGRIVTSVSAIACLQAQGGAAPQLQGHVLGLAKLWKDGSWREGLEIGSDEAVRWLVNKEGRTWLLDTVDELVEALSKTLRNKVAGSKAKI